LHQNPEALSILVRKFTGKNAWMIRYKWVQFLFAWYHFNRTWKFTTLFKLTQ
jgi:hypothetical protein